MTGVSVNPNTEREATFYEKCERGSGGVDCPTFTVRRSDRCQPCIEHAAVLAGLLREAAGA